MAPMVRLCAARAGTEAVAIRTMATARFSQRSFSFVRADAVGTVAVRSAPPSR